MSQITWADKVTLDAQPDVARINKVIDDDMNAIKIAHNDTDSKVSGLITYSTNETLTSEVWLDNKPIYRKCIYISVFPNNTDVLIDISSLNMDFVVNLYGYAKKETSGFPINGARPDTNMDACIGAWIDNDNLKISTRANRSDYSGYIILEYTKRSS